jgi:hypothetical protein
MITVAASLALGGCTGSDRPATSPVSGQVTYLGKPIAGATVVFLCPGAPRPAVGTTDASGTYQLTTFEPNDGAVVGTHVVTVKKFAPPSEASSSAVEPNAGPDTAKAIDDAVQRTLEAHRKAQKVPPEIPAKYGHRSTSPLQKDVAEGENVINIELLK